MTYDYFGVLDQHSQEEPTFISLFSKSWHSNLDERLKWFLWARSLVRCNTCFGVVPTILCIIDVHKATLTNSMHYNSSLLQDNGILHN